MKIISNVFNRFIALFNVFFNGQISRHGMHSSGQELMPAYIRTDNIDTRYRRKKGL